MEIKLHTESAFARSEWAGGSTTQLFIYPTDTSYQNRDFDLRISLANVELDDSEFTSLPGFFRKLMILEGGITISHEGHHSGEMKKFDVDDFQGDWTTRSVGRCTDFNVMTNGSWKSHLFGLQLNADQLEMIPFGGIEGKFFIYLHKGSVEVQTEIDTILLNQKVLLEIDFRSMHELQLRALDQSELAVVIVEKT
jgi:environmental stress-induced protein Ves